ncbi:unnamed protein product [Aspergillus oryzae]|uniref:Unnamed protein product n=1 Tax=Aspergillus oryzae TaxID=5062 RepID=A0AAN4YZT6_ASPOZ|nr:unnamed protein product [Aspergillus oryzae]
MDKGELFPAISDQSTRGRIKAKLREVQGRILSLRTFFDDSKCMEAWVISLRPIIPPIRRNANISFREAIFHCFQPADYNEVPLQVSGGRFKTFRGSTKDCKRIAYLMLFLVAVRNFPVLSRKAPHYTRGKKRPIVEGSLDEYQSHLARVAKKIGFASDEISELSGADPDVVAIQSFISRIRPPQLWDIDEHRVSLLKDHIAIELGRLATRRDRGTQPKLTREIGRLPKNRRCGLPDTESYEADKDYLYIDDIYTFAPSGGSHLTSLAFQRDIFICFFGEVSLSGAYSCTSTPGSESSSEDSDTNDSTAEDALFVETEDEPEVSVLGSGATVSSRLSGEVSPVPVQRTGSSNYDTASDAPESRPATYVPNYGQFGEEPQLSDSDTGEQFPRAPGFELKEGLCMYDFHNLKSNERISTIIDEFLSTKSVFVLYNWTTRQYAKFQDLPGDHLAFGSQAAELADKGYKFVCFESDSSISPLALPNLWEALKENSLILSGKRTPDVWSREEFLESLNLI